MKWRERILWLITLAAIVALALHTTTLEIQCRKLSRQIEAARLKGAIDTIEDGSVGSRIWVATDGIVNELAAIRKLLEGKP